MTAFRALAAAHSAARVAAMDDSQPLRALPGQLPPIPTDLLVRIGAALYGEDFAPHLAKALGVSHRTVLRWKAGGSRVTPFVAPELAALLAAHAASVAQLQRAIAPHARAVQEADSKPA